MARARWRDPDDIALRPHLLPRFEDGVIVDASHPPEPRREAYVAGRGRFQDQEEWRARVEEDYAYVKRDVKRIASMSAFLFAILILMWVVVEFGGVGR